MFETNGYSGCGVYEMGINITCRCVDKHGVMCH
jgi:hypothetical protein